MDINGDTGLEESMKTLQKGSKLQRVKFKNVWPAKIIYLSDDHERLAYHSRNSWKCVPDKIKSVPISEILEVRSGWSTDNFHKCSAEPRFYSKTKEACCFSVIFRHPQCFLKSLDLVAESPEMALQWVSTVRRLVAAKKSATVHFNEEQWLLQKFRDADLNKSGSLTFQELWGLLSDLNLELSQEYARQLFKRSDVRKTKTKFGESSLDREEFVMFFHQLTNRPELDNLMRDHSSLSGTVFSPTDLHSFIRDVQGIKNVNLVQCEQIIQEFEPDSKNKETLLMGPNGFRKFLLSDWGNVVKPEERKIHQDMTQPLTNYFINSSHNTYLVGGQLRGEASVEGYINALKKGARLLELDVWDGENGEPVLTHGHTLVRPILLRDVVRVLGEYAFLDSPFPVLLSIENHCSIQQQRVMASLFDKGLGDKLYRRPATYSSLPSPHDLRNKILIKAKCLPRHPDMVDGEEMMSEEEVEGESDMEDQSDVHKIPKERKLLPVAKEFSDLVSITACKLHSPVQDTDKHPVDSFVSIGERKMLGLLVTDYTELVRYTSRHLTKSYPKGMRTDSSNMDPMPQWLAGVQIVTINMQTPGEEMDLNEGFFQVNGNCGYVPKPPPLVAGFYDVAAADMGKPKLVLEIKVVSGQSLPKPGTSSTTDVVDPYVTLEVIGFHFDAKKERTRTFDNNGFNPVWDETFTFPLRAPEMALFRFCAKDYDRTSANDFIGQYSLPATAFRQGYSHIHLCTGFAHTRDPSATLFIHANVWA